MKEFVATVKEFVEAIAPWVIVLLLGLAVGAFLVYTPEPDPGPIFTPYTFQGDAAPGLLLYYPLEIPTDPLNQHRLFPKYPPPHTEDLVFEVSEEFRAAWGMPTSVDAYLGRFGPESADFRRRTHWPPVSFTADPRTGEHTGVRIRQIRNGQSLTLIFRFRRMQPDRPAFIPPRGSDCFRLRFRPSPLRR